MAISFIKEVTTMINKSFAAEYFYGFTYFYYGKAISRAVVNS